MGLTSAISTAVSGLNINQQQLDTLSQNISNANTPNYSNEVVNQQAEFAAGQPEGVSVASISRQIDLYLDSAVRSQTSNSSAASIVQNYYNQLQTLLGQPGSNGTVDKNLDTFFTSLQDVANSPSATTETTAVNAGVTVATQLSGLATSVQNLRLQADNDITSAINSVNSDLKNLYNLNNALTSATSAGQNTSGLLDERDAALNGIAQYIDIEPVFQKDGEVALSTTSGVSLLGNGLGQLSYTPLISTQTLINNGAIAPIEVTTTDSAGNVVGNPSYLATGGVSSQVTTSLTGGKIQALLSLRDTILPNVLDQFDSLAGALRDQVNSITNAGTSFPPPNSYTGQRAVTGLQSSTYTGDLRIAVLGTNGAAVSSPYADEPNGLQPLTLDLSTLNYGQGNGVLSVNNLISAINQYYGPPQNKAEIGNINNVQLQLASNTVPASGNTLNLGFSLNNISSSNANFYVSGVTVLDSSGTTIASTATTGITNTVPQFALSTYVASAANTVTITTSGKNTLTNGETVYLSPLSTPVTVGGVSSNNISGYFTVSNVTGNSFDVTVSGIAANPTPVSAVGANVFPPYATVNSGQTISTQSNGTISADISANASSPYYTVQANIATLDASGNVKTSTVSYRVANSLSGVMNNLIGATSATGNGAIVVPSTTQPLATATLVDANGNPLNASNSSYGNQQGYLKISAGKSTQSIAIDELDSKEALTGQGFSQYFGLNNFFAPNNLTASGDTVANSALNLSVNSALVNNPSLLSTASLAAGNQPASASVAPNFTYQVTAGDNSVAQKLAGIATQTVSFNAAGNLPATSTTLAQYAGEIISNVSTNTTNATNSANDSQTLLNGFTTRAQNISGVNLDQELANTVIYQNAYSASARVITVIGTMFTDLMTILQ